MAMLLRGDLELNLDLEEAEEDETEFTPSEKFFEAARVEGYIGKLKALWKFYDADNSGFITVHELDPVVGKLMDSFFQIQKDKFQGSLARAWRDGIDLKKSGQVSKTQLVEAMAKMEWDGDAEKVFDLLDYDHSGFVSLEEIDEEANEILVRGDVELGLDIVTEFDNMNK